MLFLIFELGRTCIREQNGDWVKHARERDLSKRIMELIKEMVWLYKVILKQVSEKTEGGHKNTEGPFSIQVWD